MSGEIITAAMAAGAAVNALVPYLSEAGKEAAKTVGKEAATAAVNLLGWLHRTLTGGARKALADLERAPDVPDNQADLRKRLTELLEADPALLGELRPLLPAQAETATVMQQKVEGAGAKGVQNKGDGNTIRIG